MRIMAGEAIRCGEVETPVLRVELLAFDCVAVLAERRNGLAEVGVRIRPVRFVAGTAVAFGKGGVDALVLSRRRQILMAREAGGPEGFRHEEGLVRRVCIVAGGALAFRHGRMRTFRSRVMEICMTGSTEIPDWCGETGGLRPRVRNVAVGTLPVGKRFVRVRGFHRRAQTRMTACTNEHRFAPEHRGALGAMRTMARATDAIRVGSVVEEILGGNRGVMALRAERALLVSHEPAPGRDMRDVAVKTGPLDNRWVGDARRCSLSMHLFVTGEANLGWIPGEQSIGKLSMRRMTDIAFTPAERFVDETLSDIGQEVIMATGTEQPQRFLHQRLMRALMGIVADQALTRGDLGVAIRVIEMVCLG